jgi:predicted SprT family Zn-dependent metalloprotease
MIDFNSEKNKYVLKEITTGIIAYVLKDENNRISDTHWLCQNCLDNQKKFSIYQIKKNQSGGSLFHCPSCKEEIFIPNPKPFQSPESGFDYHYD